MSNSSANSTSNSLGKGQISNSSMSIKCQGLQQIRLFYRENLLKDMRYQLFDLYITFSQEDFPFCLGAGRTKTKQEHRADRQ